MRVIVEGNIGSGKSTLLAALHAELPKRAVGWAVDIRPEPVDEWRDMLPLFYDDPKTWGLPFSLHVLSSHSRNARVPPTTLAVIERSPLSCRHVFTKLLVNDHVMPMHHWDLFNEYYTMIGWEPSHDDITLFLETPAAVCMQRVQARARHGEDGKHGVDEPYLRKLEFAYDTMLKFCAGPVYRIDGTLPTPEIARQAMHAIHGAFQKALTAQMPTPSLA